MFNPFRLGAAKEGAIKASTRRVSNVSATTKLFRSYSLAVVAIFLIGAVNPGDVYSQNSSFAPELEGVDQYYTGDGLMIATDDGYISKINPQTEFSDRSAMNGRIVHEVASGETISTIAEEYGLKTNTVLWENGLNASSTLHIGQQLVIPPVDGVTHVVQKDQDIKKIASIYGVDANTIIKQNQLTSDAVLKPGEALFVPGAKPLPAREDDIRNGSDARIPGAAIGTTLGPAIPLGPATTIKGGLVFGRANVGSTLLVAGADIGADSSSSPATGKLMIFPTRGVLTQGFHPGHYAYDIANPSQPPIWAAMDGVVIKASSGTWGGGYGNHIIIDHGNGLKTLYGHMEYLAVSVGDHVKQGQVIGKMGRTGNVRGRTGIHLHFEVIQNGVKKSPGNYF